jgi:3-oxoacyl-[acyl-carrier-protein] synthase-1
MADPPRVVVTGTGAVCGAGRTPDEILDAVQAGRSAVAPIRQWDTAGWPVRMAAEIADYNPTALVEDRKLHKLIRRTDLLGLYAAGRALDASGLAAYRDGLAPEAAAAVSDRIGVYVGAGGGAYQNQYEFFPLLTAAGDDLRAFGAELGANVNPMWLLRTLPNNVLCHVGIRYGLKGANACVTNHVVGGTLAVVEAAAGLRTGEADRAVAIGHDAPIEPQMVLYYHRVGLFATEAVRPFDAARDGSLFGEGAGALVLETADAAASRGAAILGELLGSASAAEGEGLFTVRDDGDGLARAIEAALADAGIRAAEVGMISAHGNGTRQSDTSEAVAIRRVFGPAPPPVTAFKWAFGHLIAAAGIIETVLAFEAIKSGIVPGIATLRERDPACDGIAVSARAQTPRSNVALILCRGFAGTNAALLVRGTG